MIRIVRWTYRRKTSTGFVADIMKMALKHNLWSHIENLLGDGTFPTNAQRKRVVLKTIQATEENTGRENLTSKGMDRYLRVHEELKISCWYRLLQRYPFIGAFVMTILRLLSNSFLVNGNRMNACSVPYDCYDCAIVGKDLVAHAVLGCNVSCQSRENFWLWTFDNMPMDFCGHIRQLDDDDILDVLLGQDISLQADLLDDFRIDAAYYVHRSIKVSNLIAF